MKTGIFITIFLISWTLGTLSSYFDIFSFKYTHKISLNTRYNTLLQVASNHHPIFYNLNHFNKISRLHYFFKCYSKFRCRFLYILIKFKHRYYPTNLQPRFGINSFDSVIKFSDNDRVGSIPLSWSFEIFTAYYFKPPFAKALNLADFTRTDLNLISKFESAL